MLLAVAAHDASRGIGIKGQLAWKLRLDMGFVSALTRCQYPTEVERRYQMSWPQPSGSVSAERFRRQLGDENIPWQKATSPLNSVLMGRRTWDSLPKPFKPLPGRKNFVISRNRALTVPPEVTLCGNWQEAEELASRQNSLRFVFGGESLYQSVVTSKACDSLYLTLVEGVFACDTHFPEYASHYEMDLCSPTIIENSIQYRWTRWRRV